jgi:hypothetical protein
VSIILVIYIGKHGRIKKKLNLKQAIKV